MTRASLPLLPSPRSVVVAGLGPRLAPRLEESSRARWTAELGDLAEAALARVERALTERCRREGGAELPVDLRVQAARAAVDGGDEAYRLTSGEDGVRIEANGPRGFAHALSTLAQLAASATDRLPGVVIEDAPALAVRGAMLDISRDRVPTMETLFALVERFAGWKLNHLQLYTEHTFAYAGHEDVWRDASPLTPDEVRVIDAACRARGIELVPNQNCFGHMHRWLKHDRYRPLAEVPEGVKHPFAVQPEPFSLCPSDPGSLALVAEMLDQLLPCFDASEVNVGLDETFDLGEGRSREVCAEKGVGRVYLDYLLEVHRLAASRGKRIQVWADILMHHPELVPELPRDVVAMLWGYDADHPFAKEAATVAASGLDFFVCPGTSSWQSFGGRTGNMLINVDAAVREGVKNGARGMLVTDWGDRGHLQPQAVSYAGWARAADRAWNPDGGADALAAQLDTHVFADDAGRLGEGALALGRIEEALDSGATNGTAPFFLIAMAEEPVPGERVLRLDLDAIARGRAALHEARLHLAAGAPRTEEGDMSRIELAHAAELIELGLDLGEARLMADPTAPIEALPAAVRDTLAARVDVLVEAHAEHWDSRSRPGGRADSAWWLDRVRVALREIGAR